MYLEVTQLGSLIINNENRGNCAWRHGCHLATTNLTSTEPVEEVETETAAGTCIQKQKVLSSEYVYVDMQIDKNLKSAIKTENGSTFTNSTTRNTVR